MLRKYYKNIIKYYKTDLTIQFLPLHQGRDGKAGSPFQKWKKEVPGRLYKKDRWFHTKKRGDHMPYISPNVREKFNSLSPELQDVILSRGEDIQSIHDLIRILDKIVKEGEG